MITALHSEFRNNDEMRARWFTEQGELDHTKIKAAQDVYDLIAPSKERALELNKAYRVIVEKQDFIFGLDNKTYITQIFFRNTL